MTGLAKRWVNDKGAVYTVVEDDEEVDPMITVIVLEPVGVPHANLDRIAVSRERLEDRQGWRPAPDHGRWAMTCSADGQCEYACLVCGVRCQRSGMVESMPGRNAHARHYHPPRARACSNAAVEEGGYATQRALEAAPKSAPATHSDPSLADQRIFNAFESFGRAIRDSLDREMLAVLEHASVKIDPAAPAEKPAAMSPKNYSFASFDLKIDIDGVPRKLGGFESIDYTWKSRLDAQARAHATDPAFRVPAEFRYGVAPPRPFIVSPELVSRVAEAMKQPYVAPALTPMPVRREVFGGGQWLNYALLVDPDPFDRYTRRRVVFPDGSIQEWAQPAPREQLCSWKNHAQSDRAIAAKMLTRDMSDRDDRPNIHGNVVPTFGVDPSCRPTLAGGIISLRRG